MAKRNHNKIVIFLIPLLTVLLGTCGIEDYPMIYPIPQSLITQELSSRAIFRVPGDNSGPPFTHFAIFYRIYASDQLITSTIKDTYSVINPTLASDYNAILPYIDSDTLVNANMDSIIRIGRHYYYLGLLGADIDNVLSSSILGSTLEFDFNSGKYPTMTIVGGTSYRLQRTDGSGLFSPRPPFDLGFVNSSDLLDEEYLNDRINADVANKGNSTNRYAYAAFFIAAVGLDTTTWSNIYSTPSLIHVFLLPDPWT